MNINLDVITTSRNREKLLNGENLVENVLSLNSDEPLHFYHIQHRGMSSFGDWNSMAHTEEYINTQ